MICVIFGVFPLDYLDVFIRTDLFLICVICMICMMCIMCMVCLMLRGGVCTICMMYYDVVYCRTCFLGCICTMMCYTARRLAATGEEVDDVGRDLHGLPMNR